MNDRDKDAFESTMKTLIKGCLHRIEGLDKINEIMSKPPELTIMELMFSPSKEAHHAILCQHRLSMVSNASFSQLDCLPENKTA